MVADSITDDETPVLALLYDVQATNPRLVDTILDPSGTLTEERDIRLPLAGRVRLTIVRTQPGASRSMDLLEDAVRFAEDHMGEPFPTNFVLLMYADAVDGDADGHNVGVNMIVHPDFDADDGSEESYWAPLILVHEVAHYYWGDSAERWLDEGAAEIMAIIYEESLTGVSVEAVEYARTFPCTYAANLSSLEPLKEVSNDNCTYSLGIRFSLDLYRSLDGDDFRRGLRTLYLSGKGAIDPDDPKARRIDDVRDAFHFNTEAVEEIIPNWYGTLP